MGVLYYVEVSVDAVEIILVNATMHMKLALFMIIFANLVLQDGFASLAVNHHHVFKHGEST